MKILPFLEHLVGLVSGLSNSPKLSFFLNRRFSFFSLSYQFLERGRSAAHSRKVSPIRISTAGLIWHEPSCHLGRRRNIVYEIDKISPFSLYCLVVGCFFIWLLLLLLLLFNRWFNSPIICVTMITQIRIAPHRPAGFCWILKCVNVLVDGYLVDFYCHTLQLQNPFLSITHCWFDAVFKCENDYSIMNVRVFGSKPSSIKQSVFDFAIRLSCSKKYWHHITHF